MWTRNQRRKPTYKVRLATRYLDTDWRLGTWNCRSLKFEGSDIALTSELRPRKFDIVALQELCWQGDKNWYSHRAKATFYQSCGIKNRKLGTGFIVMGRMQDRVIGWKARDRQTAVFKIKKRQQEDREEMERLFLANETRKFYGKINQFRKGFVPRADKCRDDEGNLLVNRSDAISRWRQYFNEHLNGDTADGNGIGVNLGVPGAEEQQSRR